MKIVHEIMYKVEVLYVLCVLLMGRQRNQVSGEWSCPSFRLEAEGMLGFLLTSASSPPCRSTRCWPSSVSSRDSTTCLTS